MNDAKLVAAMLENTRLARDADKFYRWKDAIVQTLLYVSNNVSDPAHAEQIRVEVDGLLARLGVK